MSKPNNYKSLGNKFGHYTRDDVKDFFRKLLMFNKEEQIECLRIITSHQTSEELLKGESIEDNSIGWSKIDAYRMPRILKKFEDSKKFKNGPKSIGLTNDHWDLLKSVLPDYWCQYAIEVDFNNYKDKMKNFFGD